MEAGFFDRARKIFAYPIFNLIVLLPTIVAAIYFLLIAAPMYTSEARFVVRTPTQTAPSSIDSVLEGVGLGGSGSGATDTYVVHEYVTSRDAVHDLEHRFNLRMMLARPMFDFVARFPRPFEGQSFENLYRAYGRFVVVGYNSQTGISTLRVQAFQPQDSAAIANALLDGGERVINQLNDRAARDAVADSQRRINDSRQQVQAAEASLTAFRNREKIVDPQKESLAGLDLVAKMEGQTDSLRASRAALAASAPLSPQLPILDQQITANENQVQSERAKIAGQDTSLAATIGEYERLTIDRDFAVRAFTDASLAAASAQLDVRRKRLYLERVVPPNVPDVAEMPRRLYSTVVVFVTCLLIYAAFTLLRAGLREHSHS